MNQQWQVCELEESSNITKTLFERFSVVSVPESWILLLDGILVCFWPNVDPGRKIRSLHYPKVDEKCVYYKCRVLLDGAKFSTYKEAKEAELIAQNVSSLMDSSVLLGSENVCDSTMNFDVSDVDMDEIDENADPNGSPDLNVSVNDVNDEIVGNDSFEYNQAMLKRSYFSKKAMAFDVENIPDESFQSGAIETMLSDDSDYSANFEFNGANFLTSTVIDEMGISPIIERATVSDALSKISAVELKLSSFMNDIMNDLNKSKEILREMLNVGGNNVQEKEETISNKDGTNVRPLVLVSDDVVDYPQPVPEKENGKQFSNGSEELNVQREIIGMSQPTVAPVKEIHYDEVSDGIQNETFTAKSVPFGDQLNVQRPEILSIEYIPCTTVDVAPISHAPEVPIAEIVVTPVESQPENVIKLPIDSIEDHIRNEDLLDEDVFVEALKNHLAPLNHEDETTYMNRTILTVFTETFFLNGVSWKKEAGRINIKNSYLLSCWMGSYGETFDANVDSDKFHKHFRRLKSALRAVIRADLNRKLNGNAKPKKGKNRRNV